MSDIIQKATKDRAVEILDYFEQRSLDGCSSRDLLEILVEVLRDGCQGYANEDAESILRMLQAHTMDDASLEEQEKEFLECYEELKAVIDLVEADIAVANLLKSKEL